MNGNVSITGNIFRVLILLKWFFAFVFLTLMLITPTRTPLGLTYFLWGGVVFLWVFFSFFWEQFTAREGFFVRNAIDSALAEEGGEKYVLPSFGLSVRSLFVFAIIIGLVWGSVYFLSVAFTSKGLLFVPQTFEISPLTSTIDVRTYDAFVSAFAVADVEELFFSGLMFPTLWSLLAFSIFRVSRNLRLSFLLTFFIAVLFTGLIASYVFHTFVFPAGFTQAFDFTFLHFTASAGLTGLTGTPIGGIIAHAMHNFAFKMFSFQGQFQTSPQLQAYFYPVTVGVSDLNSV